MFLQRLLQLVLIVIVLMVAFSLLSFLLGFAQLLLGTGLRLLVILLVIALILRFFAFLKEQRV